MQSSSCVGPAATREAGPTDSGEFRVQPGLSLRSSDVSPAAYDNEIFYVQLVENEVGEEGR